MELSLRRATAAEFDAWSPGFAAAYAAKIVASGALPAAAAREKARHDLERVLPSGVSTPGQLVFRLIADGDPAGWLWIEVSGAHGDPGMAWVYLVEVDEACRGKGYGRQAMLLAEEIARSHGMRSLGLNVHGGNAIAQSLYTSLDFLVTNLEMKKQL